jgi:hypothetical protein
MPIAICIATADRADTGNFDAAREACAFLAVFYGQKSPKCRLHPPFAIGDNFCVLPYRQKTVFLHLF